MKISNVGHCALALVTSFFCFDAQADESVSEAPPVANTPSSPAPAAEPPPKHSVFGTVIFDNLLGVRATSRDVTSSSALYFSMARGEARGFLVSPDIHVKITDSVTVGVRASFGAIRVFGVGASGATSEFAPTFTVIPTIGYLARLSDTFSVWPNLGVGVSQVPDLTNSHVSLAADVESPFVASLLKNVYLAIGPAVSFRKELTKNSTSDDRVGLDIGVNSRLGLTF